MRADLPAGTVTFLFTDIEGSTRLLHELGAERYAEALAHHRRVLREAFAAHDGVEVDTQGDAFFVAFADAAAALVAAERGQLALQDGPVSVRMGLHTGSPLLTREGYVGMDVHHGARVMAAGHGGQVLVSEATRLAGGRTDLHSLGPHRLKDLTAPQPLWQLGDGEFPPPKSLNQTNLPVQPSPLIGRAPELAEIGLLLGQRRLVTLVGSGGSGKTRLALQAAADALESFPHGVWWVPLQAIRDPALVLPTIASTVGAQAGLAEHLSGKRTLLLLDNLEQVVEAAGELAGLLEATSELTMLVTSREPLRVAGESELPVEPLPEDDAMVLFRERAHTAEPEEAAREICRRLDHLPLAIELAAARTKLLPPEQLLARLQQRLPLLTGGRRDAPERHRTLRATIEWSHELLSADEQWLFARLAVFAGSFSVDGAEAVCDADLDTLQSLVDKSLVRRWGSGRLGMLETVHEFAAERLQTLQDYEATLNRHVAHYLQLAESAELRGPDHAEWLARLRAEHANFRAALERLARAGRFCDRLRLASDLGEYAYHSGALIEGGRWLDEALETAGGCPPDIVARAGAFGALTAAFQGDVRLARARAEAALAAARESQDALALGEALRAVALVADFEGDAAASERFGLEALAIARDAPLPVLHADLANNMGYTALECGDVATAKRLLHESLDVAQPRDDAVVLSVAHANLGLLELGRNDNDRARDCFRNALEIALRHGLTPALSSALAGVGMLAANEGAAELSARIDGALDELVERTGEPPQGLERSGRERARETAGYRLGSDAATAAAAAGRAAGADQVAADALAWLASVSDAERKARSAVEA